MKEDKKNRRKRIIKRIIIGLVFLGIVCPAYVYYNLHRYSVWYSQHMPHSKDSDPVLVMTVYNIDWIHKPNIPELENYKYDTDGNTQINVYKNQIINKSAKNSGGEIGLYDYSQDNEITYYFSKDGQLIWESTVEENVTEEEQKKGRELINSIIQPYIDYQWYPIINLQFVFNSVYYDQFN